MAYTSIPVESKTKINKAGKFLSKKYQAIYDFADAEAVEIKTAQELVNRWRACHAYPLNTFQATLRTKLQGFKGTPLVAQRLKRMPTVIDKLKRLPNMKLTTMQDIGGVRAIVENIIDVNRLVSKYVNNQTFPHKLEDHKDYILEPRDQDGYRSVHLIYNYQNKNFHTYNGLRVEVQIRTKLQHIWATAVETMGAFIGQSLKTKQGDIEWLDFFSLVSSAFAHMEKTPPIPRFSHLTQDETYQAIACEELKLGILDKIKGFSSVVKSVGSNRGHSSHILVIDYHGGTTEIFPYGKYDYEKALMDYNKLEEGMPSSVEVVLVSAGPVETLRKAYPNLFLDLSEFEAKLREIIDRGEQLNAAND
jgi:putative GTP pyrophosphokinase